MPHKFRFIIVGKILIVLRSLYRDIANNNNNRTFAIYLESLTLSLSSVHTYWFANSRKGFFAIEFLSWFLYSHIIIVITTRDNFKSILISFMVTIIQIIQAENTALPTNSLKVDQFSWNLELNSLQTSYQKLYEKYAFYF